MPPLLTCRGSTAFFLALFTWMSRAEDIRLPASADTFITEHRGYEGPHSVNGELEFLRVIGAMSGWHHSHTLIKFDLRGLEGRQLSGNTARIRLRFWNAWKERRVTQSISVVQPLADWDETTTSYANVGGRPFDAELHAGTVYSTQDITYTGKGGQVDLEIPISLVESWIMNPAANRGILLISNTTALEKDMGFQSRESDGMGPELLLSATDDSNVANETTGSAENDEEFLPGNQIHRVASHPLSVRANPNGSFTLSWPTLPPGRFIEIWGCADLRTANWTWLGRMTDGNSFIYIPEPDTYISFFRIEVTEQ